LKCVRIITSTSSRAEIENENMNAALYSLLTFRRGGFYRHSLPPPPLLSLILYLEFGEKVKKRAALGGSNYIFPGLSRSEKPAVCIYGLTPPTQKKANGALTQKLAP
jgi:hypothetical protein